MTTLGSLTMVLRSTFWHPCSSQAAGRQSSLCHWL